MVKENEMTELVCKGSIALGTGCLSCGKCRNEIVDQYLANNIKSQDQKDKQKIRERVWGLQKEIEQANNEIQKMRTLCPHPDAFIAAYSDTGNWDISQNTCWVVVNCPDCGVRMRFDSETEKRQYKFWLDKQK